MYVWRTRFENQGGYENDCVYVGDTCLCGPKGVRNKRGATVRILRFAIIESVVIIDHKRSKEQFNNIRMK